jgi:hypothetical protein
MVLKHTGELFPTLEVAIEQNQLFEVKESATGPSLQGLPALRSISSARSAIRQRVAQPDLRLEC